MPDLYADLAIPVAIDRVFTYLVPDELHQSVRCGMRALAPFGTRTVTGVIMRLGPSPGESPGGSPRGSVEGSGPYKYIRELLDLEPVVTEDLLNLSRWIAKYYFAPIGEVLRSVLSVNAARSGKRYVSLCRSDVDTILPELSAARTQASIVRELSLHGRTAVSRLQRLLGIDRISPALNALAARGYIKVEEELLPARGGPQTESIIRIDEKKRAEWSRWLSETPAPRLERQKAIISELLSIGDGVIRARSVLEKTGASGPTLKILERKGLLSMERREVSRISGYDLYPSSLGAQHFVLNAAQKDAIGTIGSSVARGEFKTFLLFGVTGSGKTQVYIEAIRPVLELGKTVIVLVPEISLTPQIVRRFKHQFGERVVAQHSRMSAGERTDVWSEVRKGTASIVIGPRSAVFAPLKNLGLIVVDEEQDSSYKQHEQSPLYNARDVAIMRASFSNAVVVLGSATPSFESYSNALQGKYGLLRLPERVDNARLPEIEIVDMSVERKAKFAAYRADRKSDFVRDPVDARLNPRKFKMGSLSGILQEKIADRIGKKEGIILLQNRRGFSPFVECYGCGHVELCPNCSISLTYHSPGRNLRCHYCGVGKPAPDSCPRCASTDLEHRGFGTQRVEEELRELFPGAVLLRMDRDTTAGRNSHDLILRKFSEAEADILLGTQMVAKGLDFSRVTLVGVISADTQMLLPDFRSSERAFQLLAQVAGRAGRSKLRGEVIIQTYLPGHPTLRHVIMHDFNSFYESEIGAREQLAYPPHSRLVLLEFKGKEEREVLRRGAEVAESLRRHRRDLITLGPAIPPIARLKGLFRCHVLMKDLKRADPSGRAFRRALADALRDYEKTAGGKNRSVKMTIDVDPAGMM